MDEQKTQPIAVPASPAQTGQQTTADTQPLPQHSQQSQQSQYTQQSQYPQYGEPQYQNAQYQPASYSPQPQQNAPAPVPAKRRRWSIIIAVIAVITIVASLVGAYVYHSRHEQALSDCRNAVSEFTQVRKELLDTGGSSSQIQQLLRNMLGVSDILDAAADASSSAEQTVSAEGCAANATITQLNLVKDTVASATDSLRTSIDSLKRMLRNSPQAAPRHGKTPTADPPQARRTPAAEAPATEPTAHWNRAGRSCKAPSIPHAHCSTS